MGRGDRVIVIDDAKFDKESLHVVENVAERLLEAVTECVGDNSSERELLFVG